MKLILGIAFLCVAALPARAATVNAATSYASGTGGTVTKGYTGNVADGWGIVAAEVARQ